MHKPDAKNPPPDGNGAKPPAKKPPVELWRALLAELYGTFLLCLVGAGGVVINFVSKGEIGHAAKVVAPGLLVLAMIHSIGEISGAHINPAVSLAFALRGDFHWKRVPGYWLAQLTGAILAALVLRATFGNVAHMGATVPKHGDGPALVMEILLTAILVTVILSTAHEHRSVGPEAAIAVGGTVALCGLFASPISGASMNPAVSLGPYIVSGDLSHAWIYLAGPVTGAIIAVLMVTVLHGRPNADEEKAAGE